MHKFSLTLQQEPKNKTENVAAEGYYVVFNFSRVPLS